MFGLFFPYGIILQALAILHFVRRRPDTYWIWIILMFGGVGALIYMALEVVPDAGLLRGSFQVFPRRKRIRELEGLVLDNPSIGNYEELGDLYLDDQQFARARECFDRVLAKSESIDPFYRRALCELDGHVAEDEVVVCEVSSFQLEDIHEFKPHVAVLLNLEPDHLDRHGTFEAYADAKLRIFENQEADDVAVVPRRFEATPGQAQRIEFAPTDELPAEPVIPGAHNRENAAAATAVARALGVDDARIGEALESFPGVPHRLEPVADANGVLFVNDSKATNTAAARRAVAAYDQPLHVILGGRGKGESYTELALDLSGRARRAYLIGEAAREMDVALELAGVDHELSGDLETAVRSAAKKARPGEIVLLAPACASYDQFHDFEERGEAFKRLVAEVAG